MTYVREFCLCLHFSLEIWASLRRSPSSWYAAQVPLKFQLNSSKGVTISSGIIDFGHKKEGEGCYEMTENSLLTTHVWHYLGTSSGYHLPNCDYQRHKYRRLSGVCCLGSWVPLGNAFESTHNLSPKREDAYRKWGESRIDEKEETIELKYSFKTSYTCGLETYPTKFSVAVYPR